MAIDLKSLRAPQRRPKIITITGEPGSGKTSLALAFPKPVFISVEDGVSSLLDDPTMKALANNSVEFPQPTSSDEVFEAIKALGSQKHDFKTLVIDSVTALDNMFEQEICQLDGSTSINKAAGGWGAGFNMLSDKHSKLRQWAGRLSSKAGMHVVFIAHSATETIESPDSDPYIKTTLALHKKSLKHYVDNVDVVAHLKLKFHTKQGDKGSARALSTGKREIITFLSASNIAKNRLGIDKPLAYEVGTNPFEQYLGE